MVNKNTNTTKNVFWKCSPSGDIYSSRYCQLIVICINTLPCKRVLFLDIFIVICDNLYFVYLVEPVTCLPIPTSSTYIDKNFATTFLCTFIFDWSEWNIHWMCVNQIWASLKYYLKILFYEGFELFFSLLQLWYLTLMLLPCLTLLF